MQAWQEHRRRQTVLVLRPKLGHMASHGKGLEFDQGQQDERRVSSRHHATDSGKLYVQGHEGEVAKKYRAVQNQHPCSMQ